MSKKNRAAEVTARFENHFFFPGFLAAVHSLFGRRRGMDRFCAFSSLLFISLKSGKKAVSIREFISSAPALKDGTLVRWMVRSSLATERNGCLSLRDNEKVAELTCFVKEVMATFDSKLKKGGEADRVLWEMIHGKSL